MKEVVVKFDKDAYIEYRKLKKLVSEGKKTNRNPTYSQLLSSIDSNLNKIKSKPTYGDLIPKKQIPKRTVKLYGTDKIFRITLTGYWRLLYTIIGDEVMIIAFVLEFMDHKKYDKLFAYGGK